MAVGTHYRLSLVATAAPSLHVNTFWFRQRVDTPGTTPNVALINDWKSIMEDVYRGLFGSWWTFQEYNVWIAKGSPENISVGANFNGRYAAAGNQQPNQLSSVVTWLTGIAGRSYRGRSYFGALGNTQIQGQFTSAQYRSAIDIFAYRLTNVWNTSSAFDFVIFSKKLDTTSKVTGYTRRDAIYTQRRRSAAYGE